MTTVLRPSTIITLAGEIDIVTAPGIRESLLAAVSAGHAEFVVDMSGVTFIDASGIGVLVAAANAARAAGGGLSLRAPSSQVRRILAILGLNDVLQVFTAQPVIGVNRGAVAGAVRGVACCRRLPR